MTPKQKAKELFNKFIDEIPANTETDIIKFCEVDKNASKACALIAVDEVLAIKKEIWDDFHREYFEYWQQVKAEIEKL